MKMRRKTWLISQSQIAAGDIDSTIFPVDPEQIPDAEIYGLLGAVRLRIQEAKGPADVFVNPAARKFFRAMHARWPWAGFFLRVSPITVNSPVEQVVDLSTFMALALCHCDHLTYCETKFGIGLKYDPGELGKILAEFQGRAMELGDAVRIPGKALEKRDALITEAVVSFFDAGNSINKQNNQKRNR